MRRERNMTAIRLVCIFNSLPNDNILGLSKSKAFADNKNQVTENWKFVFLTGRKHCGKRRKCL